MLTHVDDTIVAVSSADGGAARGIIRISGPQVASLLESRFLIAAGADPADLSAGGSPDWRAITGPLAIPGTWRLDAGTQVVPCRLLYWPDARSYTRQPSAELHTLGAPPLLNMMLQQLCAAGARLARPGEFTLRAFLAGRLDLPQAEAVLGVINATDQAQLRSALLQLAGGLSQPLHALRDQLLNLCADMEAGLDFVDEDISFISQDQVLDQLETAAAQLQELDHQLRARCRADELPRVVLLGRPNVGKSTLWNRLVQDAQALVSDIPGTTRDYLEAPTTVDNRQIMLVDTAGIDARLNHPIDQAAQAGTDRAADRAAIRLLCIAANEPLSSWEQEQLLQLADDDLVVITKADLAGENPLRASLATFGWQRWTDAESEHVERWRGAARFASGNSDTATDSDRWWTCLSMSAGIDNSLSHEQLRTLKQWIARRLDTATASGSPTVANTAVRCRESIDAAREALSRALELARLDQGQELVVAEIRTALDGLGQVVGAVYTEDLLDRVFARFCIGK